MAQIPPDPISAPAGWFGADLARSRASWTLELTPAQQAELVQAAEAMADLPLASIDRASAPLPTVSPLLRRLREEVQTGLGVVLLRGFPVDRLPVDDARRGYWLLGRHLGDAVAQNGAGEVMCDIRDTGADPADPDVRLYTTSAEQDFHTDGADIIGLLCLRAAETGGISRLASSITVFNEVARERPDLVPLLFEDWHWYLHGQRPADVAPTFALPITRWDGEHLSTFFIGWWIRRAQGVPGVPALTSEQQELLQVYERVANRPDVYLDMDFRPGDMQWIRNAVVLHKRTAYTDPADPDRRRHLLRLWLAARDFADGEELLRGGVPQSAASGA